MSRLPPEPTPTPAPRSSRALLVDRNFGPWFFGNLASNTGDWLFNVTAAVVVFNLTGSALLVGLLSVGQFGPLVVLSPWAGALSDQLDRRRLALAGQVIAAASATAIAVAAFAVGLERLPGAWPVLAAALGIGIARAFASPALKSILPALVDDADLDNAVALDGVTFMAGRALGPASAGALLLTLGPETAFALNALSFLALIAAILVVRTRPRAAGAGRDLSVLGGLRHIRGDGRILLLLGGVATAGFAADPVITLAPALTEALGGGDGLVAAMVSGFGIAAVPAAVLAGRLQSAAGNLRVARTGMTVMAAGLLLAALAPLAGVAVIGFAATGAGFILAVTGFTTGLYRRVPDSLRGRVMALWGLAFLGTRPIAAVVDGTAADLAGPRPAMGIAVAVALLGAGLAVRMQRKEEGTPG